MLRVAKTLKVKGLRFFYLKNPTIILAMLITMWKMCALLYVGRD